MELYLDSADINEIKEAFNLGYIAGLTTTPTFMHRHGITDIDSTLLELAKIVPVLQVEALGNTAAEILSEVERQTEMGLDKSKTVYKIPISLEGTKACKMLVDKGYMVNIHLVYTLQQAYMAMSAGATYVCPLVGRLQDQGHDALGLVEECVDAVNYYDYNTKIMFSSVRYVEHIKNAINIGVHTCTIPWKVMKQLTDNHFTKIGTEQFEEHTKLMTTKVRDVIGKQNPIIGTDKTILDALVKMTEAGFGAVTIVDQAENVKGIFTDGDLRRALESEGQAVLQKSLGTLALNMPASITSDALLYEASNVFKERKVDTLVVMDNGKAKGMLDVQDLV